MKKQDNFFSALKNLHDISNYEEPYDNVILTGLVGLYEICFEQSWKAMKERLYHDGIVAAASGSPRSIIKEAYASGIIEDEQLWLDALQDRNNVAHAYNKDVAYGIIRNTKMKYVQMFEDLKTKMEE